MKSFRHYDKTVAALRIQAGGPRHRVRQEKRESEATKKPAKKPAKKSIKKSGDQAQTRAGVQDQAEKTG